MRGFWIGMVAGVAVTVNQLGSMLTVFFTDQPVTDYASAKTSDAARYGRHVWLSLERRGNFVEILIDDDGPGIPEDQREAVFRPFHRLEPSRNQKTGGVGLGLTIARDIARRHGGDILLRESPQKGLRAVVRLPV